MQAIIITKAPHENYDGYATLASTHTNILRVYKPIMFYRTKIEEWFSLKEIINESSS